MIQIAYYYFSANPMLTVISWRIRTLKIKYGISMTDKSHDDTSLKVKVAFTERVNRKPKVLLIEDICP